MESRFDKKRVVQDIVPTHKRAVRKPVARHLQVEEVDDNDEVIEEEVADIREEMPEHVPIRRVRSAPRNDYRETSRDDYEEAPRPRRRIPTVLVTFVVVFVAIAIIAVALSLLYSRAAVTITPKVAHFDVSTTVTTKKSTDSSFGYDVITKTETLTQTVPATSGPTIETKAKGTITLYNAQPTQQKILAGTRVSNDDGLVYRTTATVVIPQLKADKTPGSIAVAVLADAAGAEYNMTLANAGEFKVVAYKGGPKYTTVYGKIKSDIAGGFSGNKMTVSSDVKAAAIKSTQETLKEKLLLGAKSLVAANSVLFSNAYTIEYEVGEPVAKDKQTADITIKGTFYGATFNKLDLLKNISGKELDKFTAPTFSINGIEDLKFTIINSKDFSIKKGTPLIFTLKGPIALVGTFSENALKNELKGTYLKQSNAIFAHYPSISNAYALITPFWMRYFPNSADKIVVEMKN